MGLLTVNQLHISVIVIFPRRSLKNFLILILIGIFKWVIPMSIKKIIAFTGIRSDYDLLSGLYKKLTTDPEIKFGLIVEGAHLSPTYG